MIMKPVLVKELLQFLDDYAPFQLQEGYDNSGLLVGDPQMPVNGVLVTLDCTVQVVEEAIAQGANVVVAHHPILFKPLKSLTGNGYAEKAILKAIKNDIALIAVHTNLDHVSHGVNSAIADRLGLINRSILAPLQGNLLKLVTYVPVDQAGAVLDALHEAGAGEIGNYSHCSFRSEGTGSFMPGENANPYQGRKNILEQAREERLEVIVPAHLEQKVLKALKDSHPYEEVAYYLHATLNRNQETGAGLVGNLPEPMESLIFINKVKELFNCKSVRHTDICHKEVKKVALCGGSGSFLTKKAISAGADIFISADFKYHDFFDANDRIIIADIGHYESEQFTKELLTGVLSKKFPTFAVTFSKLVTNPLSYL